ESEIIAGVEVGAIQRYGATVCVNRTGRVTGMLPGEAELVPGFGMFRIDFGGELKVRERGGILRRSTQRMAEVESVLEIAGLQGYRGLQVRDAPRGVLLQPVCDPEMVLGNCETRVEVDGLLEVLDRFLLPLEHGKQKSDLILNAGRLGVELGGLF